MRGLAILLLFNVLGMAVQHFSGVPLPGNVLGFALLTGALFTGVVKVHWVEETADFLLRHFPLFFCPSIVLAWTLAPAYAHQWPAILAGLFGGTAATMLSTGWVVQLLFPRSAEGA